MRRLRWLLLVAIAFIVAAVGSIYLRQRAKLIAEAPPRPESLGLGEQGRAINWCYGQSQGERTHVEVCAAKFREVDGRRELDGVQIKLFHTDGKAYDLVTSETAQFDTEAKTLYSDGEVEITLGVPAGEQPKGRLLHIHSSGVTFSSETGIAETRRAVQFEFEKGGGSAVGGRYDPATRELRLDSQVVLDWKGKDGARTRPMHIETGQAVYLERDQKVMLEPWARLSRESLTMETGPADVFLEDGAIRRAETRAARGTQTGPGRQVDFGADELLLHFDEEMLIRTIAANRNARLVSTAATARTTVRGDRVDMEFAPGPDESALKWAVATGNGVVEADPIARAGAEPGDKRVLQSEVIRMFMRDGGEQIEKVETESAATLDLIPSRPAQPKRRVTGDKFWIDYATQNRIEKFRTTNAYTRTERPQRPAMETRSKELTAFFDSAGSLARLEQNTDFRYEEGARRANSDRAVLEQATETVTLTGSARSSDTTGWVRAETLTLNQKTGDFTAQTNVSSSREPSKQSKGKQSSMLSTDAPMQATADRMASTNEGQKIRYEGSAKVWQAANRVEADRVDIDNQSGVMEAHGKVVTQLYDKKKSPGSAGLTIVHAPDLVYSRDKRLAHYTGGVQLERPGANGLRVDARELQAFLAESGSDSSLDRAIADGAVKIVSTASGSAKGKRVRTATSEHADYNAAEQQVVLTGGRPLLVDSVRGNAQGRKLTWWVNNDKLQVEGEEGAPARSRTPIK